MSTARLSQLRSALPAANIDAYLVLDLLDIAWLSGFRGSSAALLVTADSHTLVTDFRYRTQVAEQAPDWPVVEQPTGEKLVVTLGRLLSERQPGRVGVCGSGISHAMWTALSESSPLTAVDDLVGKLRWLKDEGELATIRRAARIADDMMLHAYELIRVGMTERELRRELEYFMLGRGAEKAAFDIIVCAGPNSAMCHAKPGPRPFEPGDLLTIDLGAVVDGYHSDLTRTVAVGGADAQARAIYDLVFRAQAAALAAVRPGLLGKDVDAVARDLISAEGHGDHFGHGLGHSLGLAIHEEPRFSATNEDVIAAGMVMTIEPGVYVPGFGGVRIEDLCLVTDTGCEVLSTAPKPAELMVL